MINATTVTHDEVMHDSDVKRRFHHMRDPIFCVKTEVHQNRPTESTDDFDEGEDLPDDEVLLRLCACATNVGDESMFH